MDKKIFLEELRKSLRVLKDEEIQDIIGEYEQHIDMKVQNGLTVEQAIADFGNVKELAAEILEAYHVRAEFDLSKEWEEGVHKDQIQNMEDESENDGTNDKANETITESVKPNLFMAGFEWFSKVFNKIRLWTYTLLLWFWRRICFLGKQMKRPVYWIKSRCSTWKEKQRFSRESRQESNIEDKTEDITEDKAELKRNFEFTVNKKSPSKPEKKNSTQIKDWLVRTWKGMGNMIVRLWNFLVDMTFWCIRMCWNSAVVCTAFFIGSLGLICLFAAGVLGVLLLQGYPLTGLTVGCAGLVLSFLSAAVLVWTLMWRKEKRSVTVNRDEEITAIQEPHINTVSDMEEMEMEEGQHA